MLFPDKLRVHGRLAAAVCVSVLLLLNGYIAQDLFPIEYLKYMQSVEGSFISVTRFLMQHPFQLSWWPFWNAGMPFQHTYFPFLSSLAAVVGRGTGWAPVHAFHVVSALFYCLGPVTLFLMVREISGRTGAALCASLAYSLISPSALLAPPIAADIGGIWNPRRFHNLVYYGENPHIAALTFLPLVLLFLHRALNYRRRLDYFMTGLLMAAVALTNAFGASAVAVNAACLLLVRNPAGLWKDALRTAAIGLLAYLWISPLIPPSLLRTVLFNIPTSGGDFSSGRLSQSAMAAVVALFGLIWFWSRRWKDQALRLFLLWAIPASAPPLLAYAFDIYVFPQPLRYHLEMEMALCLAVTFVVRTIMERLPSPARVAVLAAVLAGAARQSLVYRQYARNLVQPIDVTQTIEYRTGKWMEQNLPGRRVMACGPVWLNVFTDVPQLSGGHDPTAPNWIQRIAVFVIYSGMNAGPRDGEVSTLWLQAFGVHAVHVSGPEGKEFFKPFANPRKFEGLLPVLWREGDDTIYQVPQRSASLAHVIPATAVARRAPRHGLDVEPLLPYVAALQDRTLPPAEWSWQNLNSARIRTQTEPGQVVSVQINYHPGWRATANGVQLPISADGLGLLVINPQRHGASEIRLVYDGGPELRTTLVLSLIVTTGAFLWLLRRR